MMIVSIISEQPSYPLQCTPGPRDSPHKIGSGSGTGLLDYESRDPVPDPETLPFKYFFWPTIILSKKKQPEKHGNLVAT